MPNGKPGDHPYTDIVVHGHDFYTDDIDELIRKIAKHGGHKALSDIDLLSYGWHPDDEKLTDLRQRLEDVWTSISKSSD
ncbi:MAG: hypothetical protein ACLFVJ_05245 [Persicimonas sp.]